MREMIDDMIHWVREQACTDCKNGELNHFPCLRCLETAEVLRGHVYDPWQIRRVMDYVSNRLSVGKYEWSPIYDHLLEQCDSEETSVSISDCYDDEFQDRWS